MCFESLLLMVSEVVFLVDKNMDFYVFMKWYIFGFFGVIKSYCDWVEL